MQENNQNDADQATCFEDLSVAASVPAFESAPIHTFQKELEQCIQRVISTMQCRGPDGMIHYKPSTPKYLQRCLLKSIYWVELGQCHEQICQRRQSYTEANTTATTAITISIDHDTTTTTASSTSLNSNHDYSPITPLQELVQLLLDPRVVPVVLSDTVFQALARAFVRITTSQPAKSRRTTNNNNNTTLFTRWTPSQYCLLQAIKLLAVRRPLTAATSSVVKVVQAELLETTTAARFRALLSLVKFLIKELPSSYHRSSFTSKNFDLVLALSPCLVLLLQAMDDEQVGGRMRTNTTRRCSGRCGNNVRRSRRQPTCGNIAYLHGEMDEDKEAALVALVQRRVHVPAAPARLTMKQLVNSKDEEFEQTTCPQCLARQSPTDDSISAGTARARAKCCKQLVSICQSAMQISQYRSFQLLKCTLDMARRYPQQGAVMRACVVVLADTIGEHGYHFVARLLISTFRDEGTARMTWNLRFYTELIQECSFFDDRQQCWKALQPLVQRLDEHCDDEQMATEAERNQTFQESSRELLLACVGNILTRRRRLFKTKHDNIHQEFVSFITTLSVTFGHAQFWMCSQMNNNEQQSVNGALQVLGVLGLSSEGRESLSASSRRSWSFPEPLDLRSACQRMMVTPDQKLLSSLTHDEEQALAMHADTPSKSCRDEPSAIPMLDCLNDECLRHIFSFLSYKRLVRNRRVCAVWKYVSDDDSLWKDIYNTRYAIQDDDLEVKARPAFSASDHGIVPPELPEDKTPASLTPAHTPLWQKRFKYKRQYEQDIQLGETRGFQHHMCPYIGCIHIIKTQKMLERHLASHRGKTRRILAQKKREETRKRKSGQSPRRKGTKSKKRKATRTGITENANVKRKTEKTPKKRRTEKETAKTGEKRRTENQSAQADTLAT